MSKIKQTYPIIKYPPSINAKINKLRKELKPKPDDVEISSSRDEDIFASFFVHPAQIKVFSKYPLYFIGLFWAGMLGAIYLRKITSTILVFSGIVTAIVIIIYFGLLYRFEFKNKRIVKANKTKDKQALKVEEAPKNEDTPKKTLLSINYIPKKTNIWQSEANNLLRSTKMSTANVGSSEKFFLNHLKKTFPQACFGFAYLPEGYNRAYSSDLEIILENGLGIQVEIDEPYVGKTREPHHCCNNDKDFNRDEFFLRSGWIIIRFSEHQIITNYTGCIATIARIAGELTSDPNLLKLAQSSQLKPELQWTAKESNQMEKRKFRESYLSKVGLWNDRGTSSNKTKRRKK